VATAGECEIIVTTWRVSMRADRTGEEKVPLSGDARDFLKQNAGAKYASVLEGESRRM
jgi:hypothetical protein